MTPPKDSGIQIDDIYQTLRGKMLALKSADLSLSLAPDAPWALIFEQRIGDVVATLVVLATGDASLYLTTGMVVIGGGTHEHVRKAAMTLLADTSLLKSKMQVTTGHPLPLPGQVQFYMVGDSGSLVVRVPETEIRSGQHSFSKVERDCQALIGMIREIAERSKSEKSQLESTSQG